MAVTVTSGHVSRALDFFNKFSTGGLWFCIGQTDAWPDDNNPPAPQITMTDVAEIIGFKQAAHSYLVFPAGNNWVASTNYSVGDTCMSSNNIYQCTSAGTSGTNAISGTGASVADGSVTWKYLMAVGTQVNYNNQYWQVVSSTQAVQFQARYVYIDTTLNGSELPLSTYRQIGIYSGTKLASGVANGTTAVIPSQVSSNGILEVIDNRKPIPRSATQKETLALVIQF